MKTPFLAALFVLLWASGGTPVLRAQYDPLQVDKAMPEQKELVAKDAARSRELPLRVYLPKDKAPAGVVLFSHGLGGSRENCTYLGIHWALRGYVGVFVQHPGSDESLWKDLPQAERMPAMEKAATLQNLLLRVQDIPFVIDRLEQWNQTGGHVLQKRLDLKRIGMSGHSFGALTTQWMGGQAGAFGKGAADARIKAGVLLSPTPPREGVDPKQAFAGVKIPMMVFSGTKDNSPIIGADVKSRLAIFPALPPGGKYELVLDKAEHSAFNDTALRGDTEKRNPNHHRAIQAVTTAFWDAYLRGHAKAREWLDGDKVRGVLEKDDQWRKK